MNVALRILLVACFSCSLSLVLQGQESRSTHDKLLEMMKEYKTVGLAVAAVKEGRIVYSDSLGYRDLDQKEPLRETDMFRIASISKSFSVTAAMQLVEQGKLSLDDDIGALVGFPIRNPNFPSEVITLKMLMSHTSSLNDSQGYFHLDVINPATAKAVEKCFETYKPGAKYLYCNLNFNILGTILERVSGERFDGYIVKQVLQPLGLEGGYRVDSLDATKLVPLYEWDAKQDRYLISENAYNPRTQEIASYQFGYSTPIFSPTGGMKMSAIDLARYMNMHMHLGEGTDGKPIISRESAMTMQSVIAKDGPYGLAIMTTDRLIPGKTLKGHTGSSYGLFSMMFFSPEEKFGFVLITNGCDPKRSEGFTEVLKRGARILYADCIE